MHSAPQFTEADDDEDADADADAIDEIIMPMTAISIYARREMYSRGNAIYTFNYVAV